VDGYIDEPSQFAENVKMLLDAGVVGINIEDELPKSRLRKDELFTFL
jgi:2-methylisocitrate lyase-like PEP mutase family enzyme